MPTTHLLYLHGFRSSPQSTKARMTAARVAADHPGVTWWCPQLPPSPRDAMALIDRGIAGWPADRMAVVGSSLGGFYATAVAERLGCRAALLNPAIDPTRDLSAHIGEQTAWHDPAERFFFRPEYIDELLDWREMTARYPGARIRLLEGSDHALSDFDQHIDAMLAFLELATT